MILVTGTKRSGTSLWMQVLAAAGFPVIGEQWPARWQASLREANPRGFYESRLREGIFYATNPDPETGNFLFPEATRRHAVKVFVPGLVRSDYAYLDRVIVSVRDWRSYVRSMERMEALERDFFAERGAERPAQAPVEHWRQWWEQMYELLRDVGVRRYPFRLVAYERLLEDPERVIGATLDWLGGGDRAAAVAAVEPGLRHRYPTEALEHPQAEVFDALYAAIRDEAPLEPPLLQRLNETAALLDAD